MKPYQPFLNPLSCSAWKVATGLWLLAMASCPAQNAPQAGTAQTNQPIPWSEIGANATAQYSGDGLAVTGTPEGARLKCSFQKLEGQITSEGLWLTSTVTNTPDERFLVKAVAVGRTAHPSRRQVKEASSPRSASTDEASPQLAGDDGCATYERALTPIGTVTVVDKVARFTRPGLVEEYSVSVDGVRQDFFLPARPAGEGALRVELDVTGAQAEALANGVQLALDGSGRKIAYSRLRVTDAAGKELSARLEVVADGARRSRCFDAATTTGKGSPWDAVEMETLKPYSGRAPMLALIVNDADAVYPVRIDPTFSDANWISLGGITGANNAVNAAVVDGAGNLYIGGYFTVVGDVIANYVAVWNGSSWSSLGSGMGGGVSPFLPCVFALAVSGSDLYAGGRFTTAGGTAANYIAKWNGSSWSALGSGMGGATYPYVSALALSGNELYAGGDFTTAGGNSARNIAKWNGSSWSALGSGMGGGDGFSTPPSVSALAVSGNDLYAAGFFTKAGGTAANYIAKWDGNSWSALGSGMNTYVRALAVLGSDLYAGGDFTTADGTAATNIAKWNGSSWSALGSGVRRGGDHPQVLALAVSGNDLYAAGFFTTAGGTAATNIAKWNGSSWTALGSGINYTIGALAVSDRGSNLFAGGFFTMAGGNAANYIAKWDGSIWSALGSGMNINVSALAVSGNNLYAGGFFTTAGGNAANYIAKWDGSSWSALGSGMNNNVSALAVSGNNLYAGGFFTTAGGTGANRIAKWNGSSWSALGSGMGGGFYPPSVSALAISGSNLYAGGNFTTAGGTAAANIAKWNGSSWSALGSLMGGGFNSPSVSALAISGSNLYAGGSFFLFNGIAKWDGSSWSALGSGMSGAVYALAVSGSNLYAGGNFTTAGGVAANHIAKWDGKSWSALNSGMNNYVFALAVSGSDLYAGGYFTTAGGTTADKIAKWNGSSWSALGSGMDSWVYAMEVSDTVLYAGGSFTTAGNKVSAFIARAALSAPPAIAPTLSMPFLSGSQIILQLTGSTASNYVVQASTNLAIGNWLSLETNAAPFWFTNAISQPRRFYRGLVAP